MEEQELKKLLSTTKVKAGERLKDRIVHQINAEKALIPVKQKTSSTSLIGQLSILGIMYALLIMLAAYFYYKTNGSPLQSTTFIYSAILIASTFSFYWLYTVYDDAKKSKESR